MRDGLMDRTYMSSLDASELKTTVGVYFCGPSAAAREIKSATKAMSTAQVKFKFWKEHF
jgi:NADPH oxidase